MQADRIADDSRCDYHPVDLLHDKEDDRDPDGMRQVVKLNKSDDDRWDIADGEPDPGNDPDNSQKQPDQESKLQPEDRQTDGRQDPIDHTDYQLAAEKIDEIRVYFGQDDHQFVSELGLSERQVPAPSMGDSRTLLEKEEEIDRHHK